MKKNLLIYFLKRRKKELIYFPDYHQSSAERESGIPSLRKRRNIIMNSKINMDSIELVS